MLRVTDIVVVLVLTPMALLLSAVVAAMVWLDAGWPICNGSWRLGRHGKPFRCWKFRTLRAGHDSIFARYLRDHPDEYDAWERYAKLRHDPRVTRVGRWLRRLSLDEIPQLWNVLLGDMSLYGPRPFLVSEQGSLGPYRDDILAVRPGLLNAYVAHGRSELTVDQRVRLDAKFARRMHKGKVLLGVTWRLLVRLLDRRGAR